ncbi:MAG: hypothetical protein MUE85_09750 [Microscillaceae bacterium]|jgi:hypothetical protein|nr:hypothetical protein [Microscillaceae bacterium]
MTENRISIALSAQDLAEIQTAIQTLQAKLQPLLIALDAGDKNALAKMKDKSVPFVEKVLQYAQTNPTFVPAYLNIVEMKKDFDAFTALNNILRPLTQISKNLDDTSVLCGSEAYTAALTYYNSVKQAAKMKVPGAQAIYDDLSVRFEAQKATQKKPDATN